MKGRAPALAARRLLALCYAAAAVFWALWCLLGSAVMLNYKLSGRMPVRTLTLDDLTMESLVPYPAGEGEGWYVSSDSDPQLLWQGEGYIETVRLDAEYLLPPGGVALYYLRPGQTACSERQKVFARLTAPGEYTFTLGGRYVTALRIDPDSLGGIPVRVRDVQLNPDTPWYLRLAPTAGWWVVLLGAPALAAALLAAFGAAVRRRTPRP